MRKYWGKQIFTHGRFPGVGQKQKTEKKEEEKKQAWGTQAAWDKRKRQRLNDGNNNDQATHGARKHTWRIQAAWAND